MASKIEAAGELAAVGLAAAARDPAAYADHTLPGLCGNCATPLVGAFCHACGQSAHVHHSIGHIFEEFLHGVWHFDSKAWRTVPLLVVRPGQLTRDYVHGHRARYISPLALFLFCMFLMFFVFGFVGGPDLDTMANAATTRSEAVIAPGKAAGKAAREVVRSETALAAARENAASTPGEISTLEQVLAERRAELKSASAAVERAGQAAPSAAIGAMTWQDKLREGVRTGELKVNLGSAKVDANVTRALENPDFALYRIQQKAYKLSFLLVPLSLPVLWLIFAFRRDVHTYDHVVFALYSLSFMSLLFIVLVLLARIGTAVPLVDDVAELLLFAPPVHMCAQLKGAYRLGWPAALWRTAVLGIASLMTLGLFAAMIVVVGVAD